MFDFFSSFVFLPLRLAALISFNNGNRGCILPGRGDNLHHLLIAGLLGGDQCWPFYNHFIRCNDKLVGMADLQIDSTPKGSHVSFAQIVPDQDATPNFKLISKKSSEPSTPPRSSMDLPTPPNSHIDMASSTHHSISSQNDQQSTQSNASTSENNAESSLFGQKVLENQSPSIQVHQRRAKRISAGSSTTLTEVDNSLASQPVSERQMVLEEAQKERGRGRPSTRVHEGESQSSRSRTPSPILGSTIDSTGRLSFAASLIPSAEEVRSLLYGFEDGSSTLKEEERPKLVKKGEMDHLLSRLSTMGLDKVEERSESGSASREEELASIIRRLITYTQQQEQYNNSMEQTLHDTRIRSISLLTSLRTTFAHTLASEYSLRARVESELEGARIQAKKLSVMLARSESRNEEIDRERAMSAEEEVLWQEEMKDHASAYAQQQAARARAAQMAQVQQLQSQKLPSTDIVKGEYHNEDVETSRAEIHRDLGSSPLPPAPLSLNHLTNGLDEPFEERKGDDGTVTGLGISSGPVEISTLNSSPLSTIVKERNKLLSDKRYLKSRVRDTEAQRDRLEAELKSLRPLLVRGATSKNVSTPHMSVTTPVVGGNVPSTPGRSQKRDRSRRRRQATMGDAEAEHLLLAARRLREINRQKYVDEDGRPKTPPPHSGTTPVSTQTRTPKTPRTGTTMMTPKTEMNRDVLDSSLQSGTSSRVLSNGSPLASKNGNSASTLGRWGTHERVDSSGIEDLLQAAQTVLTPEKLSGHRQSHSRSKSGPELPESEEEEKDSLSNQQQRTLLSGVTFSSKDLGPLNESPKRRRVSSAALEGSRNGLIMSPDARASAFQGGRRTRISTEGAEPFMSQSSAGLSALDLLADQAAASQHPSQSSDPSGGSGEGEANMDPDEVFESDDEEGMAIDDEDEPSRPTGEGGIGSHYYPRGAYGQTYATQPISLSRDAYRRSSQAGYTYGPVGTGLSLPIQGWNSQTSTSAPRNGIYAPRGVSPPSANSRFTAAYQNGSRITTSSINHNTAKDSSLPDEYNNQHNSNRTPQKGGNTSPDKRLPYVRWSDEEDQKLRKAINEYGQRWESVARVVGTRSYHQCRQRYLLMRRKEAAAREGTSNEESRSVNHVTAGAH